MDKQSDKYEGLRIYTVVPGMVQTPIKIIYSTENTLNAYSTGRFQNAITGAGRFENTRDIVQPAGRQAQQVGHVARIVEHYRIMELLMRGSYKGRMAGERRFDRIVEFKGVLSELVPYAPITGIVKACRDSFELIHVKTLLDKANIRYFEFRDTQEDLYEDVVTALATVPVTPFAVAGILDYLPLWTGK
jgi:hypothetical protein